MGKYINIDSKGNGLPSIGKAKALVEDGAIITDSSFKPNLVCVVENGFFDAAAYAHNESEAELFGRFDGRPKTWLIYEHVEKLAK